LAGELGDGWITHSSTLLGAPEVRAAFEEGRAVSSREGEPEILAEQYVFVGSREEALAIAPVWQFAAVADAVRDTEDPREVQRIAEERGALDDVIADWLISTDPAEHVAQIEKLYAGGATHVAVHSLQRDQEALVDFYGEDVLPRLRR